MRPCACRNRFACPKRHISTQLWSPSGKTVKPIIERRASVFWWQIAQTAQANGIDKWHTWKPCEALNALTFCVSTCFNYLMKFNDVHDIVWMFPVQWFHCLRSVRKATASSESARCPSDPPPPNPMERSPRSLESNCLGRSGPVTTASDSMHGRLELHVIQTVVLCPILPFCPAALHQGPMAAISQLQVVVDGRSASRRWWWPQAQSRQLRGFQVHRPGSCSALQSTTIGSKSWRLPSNDKHCVGTCTVRFVPWGLEGTVPHIHPTGFYGYPRTLFEVQRRPCYTPKVYLATFKDWKFEEG